MKKNNIWFCQIIKVVAFIGAMFGTLWLYLGLYENNTSYRKFQYLFEEHNSDIIITGTSKESIAISPIELWNKYGYSAYNIAEGGGYIPIEYWLLEYIFSIEKPQLCIVSVDFGNITYENFYDWTTQGIVSNTTDALPISNVKIQAAENLNNSLYGKIEFLLPRLRYINAWKEKIIPKNKTPRIDLGLVRTETSLNVVEEQHYKKVDMNSCVDIGDASDAYLQKIVDLCYKNQCEVLFVMMPYCADEEQQNLAFSFEDYAEKMNIPYINFLGDKYNSVVDYSVDFFDGDHLNKSGTEKITNYIGDYIHENYSLNDHREEENYNYMSKIDEQYFSYMDELFKNENNVSNYLMLCADSDYCVTLRVGDSVNGMKSVIDNLKDFGVDVTHCTGSEIVVNVERNSNLIDEAVFIYDDNYEWNRIR